MTSLLCKVVAVFLFILRSQISSSKSKLEGLVKPGHHVLEAKAALTWLQINSAPCFELRSCKVFLKRHDQNSQAETVSSWTGSKRNISAYITSKDSTLSWTERHLVLRKHEKLGKAALRENYRHSRAITVLETVRSVVAHLWRQAQNYIGVDFRRTLIASTEWTFKNMEAWWRTRLKLSQVIGQIFVAYFKTLKLLNVYITHECQPALLGEKTLEVVFEFSLQWSVTQS